MEAIMKRLHLIALTEKQEEAFGTIKAMIRRSGKWPSFRELQSELGYASPNSITQLIKALESKGWIIKRGFAYDFTEDVIPILTPDRKARIERLIQERIGSAHTKAEFMSAVKDVLEEQ